MRVDCWWHGLRATSIPLRTSQPSCARSKISGSVSTAGGAWEAPRAMMLAVTIVQRYHVPWYSESIMVLLGSPHHLFTCFVPFGTYKHFT